MAILPKVPQRQALTKTCNCCGAVLSTDNFAQTHSPFYPDGYLPVCNGCIGEQLKDHEFSWDFIDSLCQYAGIPFIVKEWTRLEELNGQENTWPVYCKVFAQDIYQEFGWSDYQKQYIKLRQAALLEDELPLINEKHMEDLRKKWGSNYDDEALNYLEDLYKGLLVTQNVNGALQIDQAQKICKLSYEIDSRIRAGDKDVDKFLSSYDKLVKTAEFTPKNTKNAVDFDSFAEVGHWLEKRGKQNKFYDGATRDVIDETIKNIENYNQRLYLNEGGVGDEITQRINALKNADKLEQEESIYGLQENYNLDEYDNAGYNFETSDEFNPEGGEEENE
jgi:hypothetical protein